MTDAELVQKIGNGFTIADISKEKIINRRTLEKRVLVLRDRCLCKTVAQLVLVYRNKNLIE